MVVAPGENGHDGQAADDDNLEDEDGGPHDPVEGHDARAVIDANVATLRAGQALESAFLVVQALHVLDVAANTREKMTSAIFYVM